MREKYNKKMHHHQFVFSKKVDGYLSGGGEMKAYQLQVSKAR